MIPWVRGWYDKYREEGLAVIGVHYPEFSYEEDLNNVIEAAAHLGVTYPIAVDNDGRGYTASFMAGCRRGGCGRGRRT